MNMHAMS